MKKLIFLIISLLCFSTVFSANEIIVAKDGTGHFTTIQGALNSIPLDNTEWKTIVVKNGVYDEHVMIKASYIALIGESRAGTRIEHNIARAAWNAGGGNGSNIGTGVINIAANLHDIVVANLYIRNTYEGAEDYTEVIRTETGTTKLWFINCDVLCLWKDTFAPWGKAGGMYYVADCNFRGSIDAFCPRGYCYAINSRYTETKSSSPIWHEGVAGENQRLVIQGGSVHSETNKNVKLQNSQNYAQFYYLDVELSDSIVELGKTATTYFYGVTGKSGLSWFANNLSLENRKEMDAAWTFEGKWDPENVMPSVLPFAALPQPYNGRYAVSISTNTLKWIAARNAVSHKIYFGTTESPVFVGETNNNFYQIPALEANATYYWKVITVTADGELPGSMWRFTTSNTLNPIQQSILQLIGNNNQTVKLTEPIIPIRYKMTGATLYSVNGLPAGVEHSLRNDTISIAGIPESIGTFSYSVSTTDGLLNTTSTGTITVKDPNDTDPNSTDITETDYTSTRLATYITSLNCLSIPQEPAWITKGSSVSWSSGTGYKWGSSSAILTLKVTGCTSIECTFTNSNISRPVNISDNGSGNEKTAYPTAVNTATTVIFTPKTTGDDDITIKTSGSSGMVVTKLVLYGVKSAVETIGFDNENRISIENGQITSTKPVDLYTISGQLITSNKNHFHVRKGMYIVKLRNSFSKIIVR
jgi:pectinesterase